MLCPFINFIMKPYINVNLGSSDIEVYIRHSNHMFRVVTISRPASTLPMQPALQWVQCKVLEHVQVKLGLVVGTPASILDPY